MATQRRLKKDLFGEIRNVSGATGETIVRDAREARAWLGWLARLLLRREARILALLEGLDGVPCIIAVRREQLERQHFRGQAMQDARPDDPCFHRDTMRLLRRIHRAGVVHNDLAKEPNILVRETGEPVFLDFQLAWAPPKRGRLFRTLAYEDIRHVLKHKRSYCPGSLTLRERKILRKPSAISRLWANSVRPVYRFVTRRLMGWADREGAADRGKIR